MTELPPPPSPRFTLRDLPLSARLVLSLFLVSAGISVVYGLIQVHFQDAARGELLPDAKANRTKYAGEDGVSTIERLLTASEHKPFNGSGSMLPAFFRKSAGWKRALREKAKSEKVDDTKAEEIVRAERKVELETILAWIRAGGKEPEYEQFPLPEALQKNKHLPNLSGELFSKEGEGKWQGKVSAIFELRCVRCHSPNTGGPAAQIHLNTFEGVKDYLVAERGTGMSLQKRAQTTHVHSFGFSMLYALTGLILAFSSYPGWLRLVLCPIPLLAMVGELICWWLPLLNPMFADLVEPLAIVTLAAFGLHIVLSLLNMYGVTGKIVLLLLFIGAAGGGYFLKTQVIDPYLISEKGAVTVNSEP
jgi:hypothetical protein